ncbi:hypothetical protein F5X99DRAFT_169448 [Biscogniauxia marginata]|nr:hypothetical protein F5X99DRAFT_169448 [Biscogniauxia marginata]
MSAYVYIVITHSAPSSNRPVFPLFLFFLVLLFEVDGVLLRILHIYINITGICTVPNPIYLGKTNRLVGDSKMVTLMTMRLRE